METIRILTRAEFFQQNPPSERVIRLVGAEKETVIPIGEEIVCDFCNDSISDVIYVYNDSHALCVRCGRETAANLCKESRNED